LATPESDQTSTIEQLRTRYNASEPSLKAQILK